MCCPGEAFPVFLDRDGTMIVDKGYLGDVEAIEFEQGAVAGLKALTALGAMLIVVTNQSGIGRGYFDRSVADAIHRRLDGMLRDHGVTIAGWKLCPHAPEANCSCRKPAATLGMEAASELGLDLARAFMIGDKMSDMAFASAIGACGVLVTTGEGACWADRARAEGRAVVRDLVEAAAWIGGRTASEAEGGVIV